jgi:hypothetical protein
MEILGDKRYAASGCEWRHKPTSSVQISEAAAPFVPTSRRGYYPSATACAIGANWLGLPVVKCNRFCGSAATIATRCTGRGRHHHVLRLRVRGTDRNGHPWRAVGSRGVDRPGAATAHSPASAPTKLCGAEPTSITCAKFQKRAGAMWLRPLSMMKGFRWRYGIPIPASETSPPTSYARVSTQDQNLHLQRDALKP